MKVITFRPIDWIGPYQLANMLKYVGVSDKRCGAIGDFLKETWVNRLCEKIQEIRVKMWRPRVLIDRWDTWSMDITLTPIILPMLKQLRETKQGSPGTMPAFAQTSDSAQFCFDFYDETNDVAWEAGHQQWKDILDEMIWTFEQLNTDWEDQYWKVHPEIDFTEYPEDEGKTSTPLRWAVEGVCDYEGMHQHGLRIQRGLELFGKYYSNLWD